VGWDFDCASPGDPVKRQFTAGFIILGLLVLLVQDIPLAGYLRGVETDRITTRLERDAFVLAGRSEAALRSPGTADDESVVALARRYRGKGGPRVVIVNNSGTAIVTSDDDQSKVGSDYGSRPEIATAMAGTVATGSRFSQTLQTELLYVTVPVLSGSKVLGAVRLTYPKSVVTTAVNDQLKRLALVALTTVLLAGVAAFVVAQSVTRRLEALRSATEALADGDLTSRADETAGAPEIRSLSTSFNQMASRLDTLLTQQRTFAADASHQLRTPLTALRLRLERARDLLTTDPAAAEERLSAADVEAERLGTLVDGLLLLSRTDANNAPRTVVDLAVVARERVDAWHPLATELGLTLTLDAAISSPGLAVATAAEQIVDNYIDNAMSASPPGGSIHVSVVPRQDEIVVEVRDQGPGMSEEDCVRAFDRFWRAESGSAGTGLGLAIVARLAQASGATVDLKTSPGRGLIASATFQAVDSA